MTNKRKISITALTIIFVASACLLWVVNFNQPDIKSNAPVPPDHVFGCHYTDDKSPARCYERSDSKFSSVCLGYYELIGKKMEDGIDLTSGRSPTCDGVGGSTEYYYDKDGKYLE